MQCSFSVVLVLAVDIDTCKQKLQMSLAVPATKRVMRPEPHHSKSMPLPSVAKHLVLLRALSLTSPSLILLFPSQRRGEAKVIKEKQWAEEWAQAVRRKRSASQQRSEGRTPELGTQSLLHRCSARICAWKNLMLCARKLVMFSNDRHSSVKVFEQKHMDWVFTHKKLR